MDRIRSWAFSGFLLVLVLTLSATPCQAQGKPGGAVSDSARIRRDIRKLLDINKLRRDGRVRILGRPASSPEVNRADRLMLDGDYEGARDILIPLWHRDSTRMEAARSLKRAYRGLKDYQALKGVIEEQLRDVPGDIALTAELADTYFLLSDPESAHEILQGLISVENPGPERFKRVAQSYVHAGRYTEGIETYRHGREVLGDSLVFAEELGRLFEARREYASAVDEHFRWLEAHPKSRGTVQRRITNLTKVAEAAPQITAALERIILASPENEYAHRLYGDLLFEAGEIDSAFAEYRRADDLAKEPGGHQISGIERCLEIQAYAPARDHAHDFLNRYPKHTKSTQVSFALARAELGLNRPDVAVRMLKELAAQIPVEAEKGRVEYEIGEIYRVHAVNMDSARVYFYRAVERPGHKNLKTWALSRLGDIELYLGNIEAADSIYHLALKTSPSPKDREEILFRITQVMLFRGDYDLCTEALKKLVADFPRGMYVNDALEMTLLLSENKDELNWTLNRYVGGMYARYRGMTDSALVRFGELASDSTSRIADRARFQIAEIHSQAGLYDDALSEYRALIAAFPESFLVPMSWAAIGELYEGPLNDPAEAREAYQTILTEYRDSPLVEEARLRLRRLSIPQ